MSKNAREIAFKVLYEINEKKAYSNISLNRNIDYSLSTIDNLFIREIVYGVLENRLFLDWIIKKFSKIKFNKISPIIKEILRMGIYQIYFMSKVPDRAAIYESVKLAKKYSHKGTHGFVNGILRSVQRNRDKIELPDSKKSPLQYLSIKYSHPIWMVEGWVKDFGYKFTEELSIANNSKPKLNIRVNTLKINGEELVKRLQNKGLEVEKTKYADDGLIIKNPVNITELEEFKKGYFQIQDESSMLVAQIMNPKKGSLVVDVCSAPGGKATHIAQKMSNTGKIIARDIYSHKLKLIKENADRLGITNIHVERFNARELDEKLIEKTDYCLVDAPCSGLGLLRRKPDIKWGKQENDIKIITKLQYEILENSSKYLKRNGILIYSTCTINPDENIRLVKRFLEANKNFKLMGFEELIDDKENMETIKEGYIELYPNIHDTDGFFIAKLMKI